MTGMRSWQEHKPESARYGANVSPGTVSTRPAAVALKLPVLHPQLQ